MTNLLLLALAAFFVGLVFAFLVWGMVDAFAAARQQAVQAVGAAVPERLTVIIPARNAGDTLAALLQDLNAQEWPKELLEVLVVDDHSTDDTAGVVRGMMARWPSLRLIKAVGQGKKAALAQGVAEAQGAWLLVTDADGRCGPKRVPHVMRAVQQGPADLLLLPVATLGRGWLGRVQAAEQMALLGVAAATAHQGYPLLANGANMAFRKEAFLAVKGFEGDRWASGDDLFLLKRMRRNGFRTVFLADPEVVVSVEAEPSLGGFWQQRLRWAGKMRAVGGGGAWMALLAVLVPWFLLYVSCSVTMKELVLQRPMAILSMLTASWLLWSMPVLSLVRAVGRFLRRAPHAPASTGHAPSTLLALAAFSIYAPLIAVASLFFRPKWKGRRI